MRALQLTLALLVAGCSLPRQVRASEGASTIPAWLQSHIGDAEGRISATVLSRARSLYIQKVKEGRVRNGCYFAMDATRPAELGGGALGKRFYIICEAAQSFRAVSAGHGSGRNLAGLADFANDRRCARNFGNAQDSLLTAGGNYITAETTSSFKGFYKTTAGRDAPLIRSFIQFDGEGETANARERVIGGHAAEVLKNVCLRRDPANPHANRDGYVPVGTLVDYGAGRSNGCTSWKPSDAAAIESIMNNNPTTLYIYPESKDIEAIVRSVRAGGPASEAATYWNSACLREIGTPRFWPKATLEPIIARYSASLPPAISRPAPICKGS